MANGPRRNWASQQEQPIPMGLWAQDPNAGQAPAVKGFGGAPYSINRFNPKLPFAGNAPTEQSINALAGGNATGTSSFVDSMNNMNLGGNSFFGQGAFARKHPNFYAQPPGDPNQTTKPWGGEALKSLGGLGGLTNIGLTGWGLLQQGRQIDDLRDYRQDLIGARNASLALDKKKMGLVEEEYRTRSKKRQADMWSQRLDPASGGTANPYMSNLIQDA